jgi:hypothetical protein
MELVRRLTRAQHSIQIGESTVSVTGTNGPVHATWTLHIDNVEVDQAKAAGDFTLRGQLADGTEVKAAVHQSMVGPTEVVIHHAEQEVARFQGFVA